MEMTVRMPANYNLLAEEEMTYTTGGATVLEAVCAVLLLLMGMGLKVIFQTLKEIMQQQRVCNDRFADRTRNDMAHKHFYDELERLRSYAAVFGKGSRYHYYIFSKAGFTEGLENAGQRGEVRLVTLEEMYSMS